MSFGRWTSCQPNDGNMYWAELYMEINGYKNMDVITLIFEFDLKCLAHYNLHEVEIRRVGSIFRLEGHKKYKPQIESKNR